MESSKILLTSLLILMITLGPATHATTEPNNSTSFLTHDKTNYQSTETTFDPYDLLAKFEQGVWTTSLFGKSHNFEVELMPAQGEWFESADGSNWTKHPEFVEFPFKSFRLTDQANGVQGVATLTSIGIAAMLREGQVHTMIEPFDHNTFSHQVKKFNPLLERISNPNIEVPIDHTASLAAGPSQRVVYFEVDSQATAGSGQCLGCHIVNGFTFAQDMYANEFSWSLSRGSILQCTSTVCDQAEGLPQTTNDPFILIDHFSNAQFQDKQAGGFGSQFDLIMGITSRPLTNTNGIAWLPGPYSIVALRDNPHLHDYHGRSSAYEFGGVMAHELGHNFYGTHDDGRVTKTTVTRTECEPGVPLIEEQLVALLEDYGSCPEFWTETYEENYWDYTIMCCGSGGYRHDPPYHRMIGEFSNVNWNRINTCFTQYWSTTDYDPDNTPWLQELTAGDGCYESMSQDGSP